MRERLFPRRGSTPGSINVDTRFGRAVPAFDHYIIGDTDRLHYYIGSIETQAPTTGIPRQYAGVNKTMHRLDNGTITADTTFNDVVQGMVICDAGGAVTTSIGTLSAGTKMLLVGFGSSTNPRVAYRGLATDTTAWTVQTSSTYAQFWLVVKAGADLYAVTDAGVAILGEYRISKCPAGNDPTLAASWGNGLEVGTPEWGITGIASIGDSVVVGKPDGLYYYNDQTKRFENVLPHLVDAPHAVNGKGLKSVVNGVLYPTHDGKLYFFDGVACQEVTPEKSYDFIPRDVANSRITAIADNGETVAVVRECWGNSTQGLGLKVITYIAGTVADVTSAVTDGSLSTGATLTNWGGAANDRIFVGADVPLEGFIVRVTANVNAAVQSFAIRYSNGTAGSAEPFTTSFTAASGIIDNSILSTASTSLVNTGFPPGASNAFIGPTDFNMFDLQTSTALTFAAPVSATLTKYWYALTRVSSTAFTSGTRIDEVEIIPSRAGLPITAANDFTHRWRAGGLTIVEMGTREQTTGFRWRQAYVLNTYGGVWAAAWHSGRPGQASGSQNMGQQLILWGRHRQVAISEGPTRDPARTIAPRLALYGTTKPGPLLDLTPGGWDGGDPMRMKEINGIAIDGRFAQAADKFHVYVQYDENDVVLVGTANGLPEYIPVAQSKFRRVYAWLGIEDSVSTEINAPQILSVDADFDWHDLYEFPRDRDTQTPETT